MPNIFIYDEFSPEDIAMMQALYSRSPESVEKHAEKVMQTGSGKFMEKFYVQYGHNSIADCGSTTIFIEKISMLGDKAIQDWPLYSGQETSTRYIDMSKQAIVDPISNNTSRQILRNWMKFYINSQDKVKENLKIEHPRGEDQDETIYEKAIEARTFDIMRGFLPAGITTQLSWHTNLRQANDKLALMLHHPLTEVKKTAVQITKKLQKKYPHSFSHKLKTEQEKYKQYSMYKYNYYNPENPEKQFSFKSNIDQVEMEKYKDLIQKRPAKTNLPNFLSELGNIVFDFMLDFGSFRDIQRHRNGNCRMPLLTTKHGFNKWYINQLPQGIKEKAEILIQQQSTMINSLPISDKNKQYYIAMGFNVPCRVSYSLPSSIYVIELRSSKSVHPTLRKIAHQMDRAVKELFPGIATHSDTELSDWDIKRGKQDIVYL